MNATAVEERAGGWSIVAVPVLLAAGILGASWLKADLPNNDFERFDNLRLTVLFFVLIAAACLGHASLALEPRRISAPILALGWTVAAALLLAAYPVGSKDVLVYAFTGRVWETYAANPFLAAPASFSQDPWRPFLDVVWAEQPSPYGPLFLWQARIADALGDGSLAKSVALHKLLAILALAGVLVLSAPLIGSSSLRFALLAWNPLLLFESAAAGHNDAVVALLLVGAVRLHDRGGAARLRWAPAALSLALWYKWYPLLFLPAFGVAAWRAGGRGDLRRWVISAAAFSIVLGVLLFAPLAAALPDLAARLLAHENLSEIFPLQLSPVLRLLFEALSAAGFYDAGIGWQWFHGVRLVLFGASVGAAWWLLATRRCNLVQCICLSSVSFTMLLVTVLWPWHLQVPVLFALLSPGRGFLLLGVALTAIALLSYFLTFAWATVLFALLGGVLWWSRRARARRALAAPPLPEVE